MTWTPTRSPTVAALDNLGKAITLNVQELVVAHGYRKCRNIIQVNYAMGGHRNLSCLWNNGCWASMDIIRSSNAGILNDAIQRLVSQGVTTTLQYGATCVSFMQWIMRNGVSKWPLPTQITSYHVAWRVSPLIHMQS
jgi:hypothetical protein